MPRTCVISGLGVLSGCGAGAEALWSALLSGTSAIKPMRRIAPGAGCCALASEVPESLGAKDYVPKGYRKAVKVMARDTELAVIAASLAVKDAGLTTRADETGTTTIPSERLGCQIGAGLIPGEVPELAMAFATACDPAAADETSPHGFSIKAWGTIGEEAGAMGGMNNLTPLWLLKFLPNMLACHVTILHGAEGPSNTHTCSEASGLLSLGETCRVIERGGADACFSGGAESKVNLMGTVRNELLGRLVASAATDAPGDVLRPYDPTSRGAIPGEGAGILIVEEAAHASARGARSYARVLGFGAAQSVMGIQSMPGKGGPTGRGLALAIRAALRDASVTADQIDVVIPQALGLAANDAAELAALRDVFGARLESLPLVLLTPFIGDCAAGAGGLAAAVASLCLHHGRVPPVAVTVGPSGVRPWAGSVKPGRVLACTSSLAGQNAAMVFGSV